MSKSKFDEIFDEMLEESAKVCREEEESTEAANEVSEEQVQEAKKSAKEVLEGFLRYIRSSKFNTKIEGISKEYDVPKAIVKNHFIGGMLRKIADILHLTITITAEIIKHAVEFIAVIINKVVDFCYTVCIKLTNLLTLNCGSMA